jgi:hypothetical protein
MDSPPTVVVFRGPAAEPFRRFTLASILRVAMARMFGASADRFSVQQVLFYNVPDDDEPTGRPVVHNLNPDWGYARLNLVLDDAYSYSHPHPLWELIGAPLQLILTETDPSVEEWGFCVVAPGLPSRPTVRPTPAVPGAVSLLPYDDDEAPPFRISPVVEPPPPTRALADFGVAESDPARRAAPVKVLVPSALADDLTRTRPFSAEVEEGGFLVGKVWTDADDPAGTIIELGAAPPAEHTGASFLHFTFTGTSFDAVKRDLRGVYGGNRLVGWYHTHLFPATDAMGLSSIDLRLHFTTFRQPWQVAGLLNLEAHRRVLRFYVRSGDHMTECPQWVIG